MWDCFSVGIGGRYWRFDARGFGDLEATVVGVTNPAPQPGCDPVEPAWKGFESFKGYVHPRQPTAKTPKSP